MYNLALIYISVGDGRKRFRFTFNTSLSNKDLIYTYQREACDGAFG
jgi:hypothetical protein